MYLILKVKSSSIWIKTDQVRVSTFTSRHTLVKKAILLHKMARVPFDLDLAVHMLIVEAHRKKPYLVEDFLKKGKNSYQITINDQEY